MKFTDRMLDEIAKCVSGIMRFELGDIVSRVYSDIANENDTKDKNYIKISKSDWKRIVNLCDQYEDLNKNEKSRMKDHARDLIISFNYSIRELLDYIITR